MIIITTTVIVCTHLLLWVFQSLAELGFCTAEIKHNFVNHLNFDRIKKIKPTLHAVPKK